MTGITGEEIDALRALVPAALDWACVGGPRNEDHPHYAAVTEHRDKGKARARYSSCADLAHWLFFHLGCRQAWINRDEHRSGDMGRPGFDFGPNVSRLAFSAEACCRPLTAALELEAGDVLIVWNDPKGTDAHVMVVYSFEPTSQRLVCAEFGLPGANIQDRTLHRRNGQWFVGARAIQRWLPLAAVITNAAELGKLEKASPP
jgi:hypothetical protein